MKKFTGRFFVFFVLYYAITFLAIAGISQFHSVKFDVVPEFAFSNRICVILLAFFYFIPTLQVSGILIVFSWYFSDLAASNTKKNNSYFASPLIAVFITSLVLLGITVCVDEIFKPIVTQKIQTQKNASTDFEHYLKLAKSSLDEGDYIWADIYAAKALQISPSSEKAILLSRSAELKRSQADDLPVVIDDALLEQPETMSLQNLLEKANRHLADKDFFEAHYYASLVMQLEGLTNSVNDEAKKIAEQAWKMLTNMNSSLSDTSERIFAQKKEGYAALMTGKILQSYYTFKDLQKIVPLDPDVDRFLSLAEEEVKKKYFFIDETNNLQTFETARNIYFSCKNPDDSLDVVKIAGIAKIEEAGNLILYLRDLNVINYSPENVVTQVFEVAYAKMTVINADTLDSVFRSLFRKSTLKSQFVPYVILSGIERDKPGLVIEPKYTVAIDKEAVSLIHIFSLSFEDFLLITEAARGPETMLLTSLTQFLPKAQQYGYAYEVYYQVLCKRLCMPFLYLLLSLLAAIIAWKFRLKNETYIKFQWLFFIPLLTILVFFTINLAVYAISVLIYVVIGYSAHLAIFIVTGILIFLIFVCSIIFLSSNKA